MEKPRLILCPVDFSEGSDHALQYAIDLAKDLGSSLEVVHAYEMPLYNVPAGLAAAAGQPGQPFDFGKAIETELDARMEKLRKQVDAHGVPVQTRVLQGAPAPTIVDHAKALDAGMIVMGTHGRTGLQHLLVGSVAERVVRLAQCPVLTVRMK